MIDETPPARTGKTPHLDCLAPQSARDALADLIVLHRESIEAAWRDSLLYRQELHGHWSPDSAIALGFSLCDSILRNRYAGDLANVIQHLETYEVSSEPALRRLQSVVATMSAAMSPIVVLNHTESGYHLKEALQLLVFAENLAGALVCRAAAEAGLPQTLQNETSHGSSNATNGSLSRRNPLKLVCADDVPSPEGLPVQIREPLDGARLRRAVAVAASNIGLGQSSAEDLSLAVGEAASNVLKHAGEGCAHVWCRGATVYVRIADQGAGIAEDVLPNALMPGWSSEVSLGMGFTLMLEMADALWLATGSKGTTICIEKTLRVEPSRQATPTGLSQAAPEGAAA